MTAPRALSGETLLVHSDFLRALARSLVRDRDTADDVVQQAFSTACERPPRSGASLRAWLAAVVRHFATDLLRRDGARPKWEQHSAAREALPSTEEIVAREDARRDVVQAVLALEPLYRDVILMRYYEDLKPREMARRCDAPVETIRTRLKRAEALLRAELDARYDERRNWALLVAPLAFEKSATIGLWGVTAAGLLAASVLGAVIWLPRAVGLTGPSTPFTGIAAVLAAPAAPMPPAQGVATRVETQSLAFVSGRVTDGIDGPPLAGARLFVEGGLLPAGVAPLTLAALQGRTTPFMATATADAEGRWEFEGIAPGMYFIGCAPHAAHALTLRGLLLVGPTDDLVPQAMQQMVASLQGAFGGAVTLEAVAAPGSLELVIAAQPGGRCTGRVLDAGGNGLSGAEVTGVPMLALMMASGSHKRPDAALDFIDPLVVHATTDASGNYELPGLSGLCRLLVRSPAGSTWLAKEVVAGAACELDLALAPPLPVAGRVVDGAGHAIAASVVHICTGQDANLPGFAPEAAAPRPEDQRLELPVGADGTFACADLAAALAPWNLVIGAFDATLRLRAVAPGYVPAFSAPFDARQVPTAVDFTLTPARDATLLVRDEVDATPRADAVVTVADDRDAGPPKRFAASPEGRVTLRALDPAHTRLTIAAPGCDTVERQLSDLPAEATEVAIDLVRSPWIVHGSVVGLDGEPIAKWGSGPRLFVLPQAPERPLGGSLPYDQVELLQSARASFDVAQGTFTATPAFAGDRAVVVLALPDGSMQVANVTRGDTREPRFTVDPATSLEQRAFVIVNVVDAASREPILDAAIEVCEHGSSVPLSTSLRGEDFGFRLGIDRAGRNGSTGRFDLRAARASHGAAAEFDVALAAGTTVGPITLALGPPATLRLHLAGAASDRAVTLGLFDAGGADVAKSVARDGESWLLQDLGSGRHRLFAQALPDLVASGEVELTAGGTSELGVTFQRASIVAVAFDPATTRLRILDVDGTTLPVAWTAVGASAESPTRFTTALVPGHYRVLGWRTDGSTIDTRFEVASDRSTSVTIDG